MRMKLFGRFEEGLGHYSCAPGMLSTLLSSRPTSSPSTTPEVGCGRDGDRRAGARAAGLLPGGGPRRAWTTRSKHRRRGSLEVSRGAAEVSRVQKESLCHRRCGMSNVVVNAM